MSNRLLIASNRLPMTMGVGAHGVELLPSSGGLASGLRPCHERSGGLWFGWPGDDGALPPAHKEQVDRQLRAAGMAPVHLTQNQVDGYYHRFANRILWPLLHYSTDRVPVDADGWTEYQEVNAAFADDIASEYRRGDTIWVHDYHLMLLPQLLRHRLPNARIGFFLHIPFPSSEVFRVLPWRRALLHGMLGADLIGFHTFGYMRHFMTSLLHVDGVEAELDRVRIGTREVTVGVFPMGVDAANFAALATRPDVRARVEDIRREAAGRRIVLGIDRLDYTKGIPQRLEAIARVFERDAALRDGLRYIQIAVPSRGEVDSYRRFRHDVELTVGRMNGAYGTLRSLPLHYVHQSVSQEELVALYCAADVMVVTPLRDGMNLVAKEFAASRVDDDGVLILSEFAGAAAELQGAVTVNPYDVEEIAASIHRGLWMPAEERRARMMALRRRVCGHNVFAWADTFLHQLCAARPVDARTTRRSPEPTLSNELAVARLTRPIRLLLDYDGTLVPLARSPELATPDKALLDLLEEITATTSLHLDIVSGRTRESLTRWFGHLAIGLWAEHGFWRRTKGDWEAAMPADSYWLMRVRSILEQFVESTPGARIEVKSASLAWHYRGVPRDFGLRQAHELRLLLGDLLSNQPLEVLEGKKVIEVRMRGVNKGIVAQRIQAEAACGALLIAIGDDRTDDDLFRALPSTAISIAVGHAPVAARFRVNDYRNVRRILRFLSEEPGQESGIGYRVSGLSQVSA